MAQALERIAQRYRAFAIDEARGVSEAYEGLALGIATAPEILDFIASVPSDRRQPNLFLAAVRSVCGVPENTTHLQLLLRQEHERIRSVMLSRTTQTNERIVERFRTGERAFAGDIEEILIETGNPASGEAT